MSKAKKPCCIPGCSSPRVGRRRVCREHGNATTSLARVFSVRVPSRRRPK